MHLMRTGALMGFESMVSKAGCNPIQMLGQLGFSSGQLRDPNTYVSYAKVADLLALASQHSADAYSVAILTVFNFPVVASIAS